MNLIDVAKTFGSQEACNDFLEELRWPDGPHCVNCDSGKISKYVKADGLRTVRKNGKPVVDPQTGEIKTKPVPARILYVCRDCKRQFSVAEGTIFNDTHLSLEKWFMATALMVNAKKGLSAKQLQRDLNCAYKTAWYLGHRIRKAMGLADAEDTTPLSGVVEADEAYIGGKYDKRRKRAKYDKEPVFGVIERGGRARTVHMPEVTLKNVAEQIKDNVSTLRTPSIRINRSFTERLRDASKATSTR